VATSAKTKHQSERATPSRCVPAALWALWVWVSEEARSWRRFHASAPREDALRAMAEWPISAAAVSSFFPTHIWKNSATAGRGLCCTKVGETPRSSTHSQSGIRSAARKRRMGAARSKVRWREGDACLGVCVCRSTGGQQDRAGRLGETQADNSGGSRPHGQRVVSDPCDEHLLPQWG
jgi:hypothetical protein